MATSASTAFFHPIRVGARRFVDGSLGANNPVDEVWREAMNIWCPSESDELKSKVKCFISLGTGNLGLKPIDDDDLSKTAMKIATETEKTAREFVSRWRGLFCEDRYFRFNVAQGLQDIGLDEWRKQGDIEASTEHYLTSQEEKFRVQKCVANLRQKQIFQ
jgi:predicted acylesterase/phospholipase RssA